MLELFTLENLFTLAMLVLLQAVLGFDNLLYISLESQRVPPASQAAVRRMGIGIAMALRLILLFAIMRLIDLFQEPLFGLHLTGIIEAEVNLHAMVVLLGGVLILYTATKEVLHMMTLEDEHHEEGAPRSVAAATFWIVLMNAIFSVDSILSAMALSDVFAVMATAIVIGAVLMIALADRVAGFLQRNRMYEVLGLFILFVVGIMLLSEGGHLAHLTLGGHPVHAMTKTTFYFVIGVLVMTDIVQTRYKQKLQLQRERVAGRIVHG